MANGKGASGGGGGGQSFTARSSGDFIVGSLAANSSTISPELRASVGNITVIRRAPGGAVIEAQRRDGQSVNMRITAQQANDALVRMQRPTGAALGNVTGQMFSGTGSTSATMPRIILPNNSLTRGMLGVIAENNVPATRLTARGLFATAAALRRGSTIPNRPRR